MATILILEDSQVLLTKLSTELTGAFPNETILQAKTVAEAHHLIDEHQVDAFVVDIMLPDGNGIDFLCDVKMTMPEAGAVVMTAAQLPEYRDQAESLGVIRFFQKPVDTPAMTRALKKVLPESSSPDADSFQASLSSLSTVDIIQLKCLGRATQVLAFTSSDGTQGKIHFNRGEIVHAQSSTQNGMNAFIEIVGWKGGKVIESPEPITSSPTIQDSWQNLLMEAVRLIDEAAANP